MKKINKINKDRILKMTKMRNRRKIKKIKTNKPMQDHKKLLNPTNPSKVDSLISNKIKVNHNIIKVENFNIIKEENLNIIKEESLNIIKVENLNIIKVENNITRGEDQLFKTKIEDINKTEEDEGEEEEKMDIVMVVIKESLSIKTSITKEVTEVDLTTTEEDLTTEVATEAVEVATEVEAEADLTEEATEDHSTIEVDFAIAYLNLKFVKLFS